MKRVALFLGFALPLNGMECVEQRMREMRSVPGVPEKIAVQYLDALLQFAETDPQTGQNFDWLDLIDYEFLKVNSKNADIITRYKHAIVAKAHSDMLPTTNLVEAKKRVDQDSKKLFYVLTAKEDGAISPEEWLKTWATIKKEVIQSEKENEQTN